MIVFVDSSAWVALYHQNDTHTPIAQGISENLVLQHASLVTSNYIVAEALTIVSQRSGKQRAQELGNYLLNGAIPVIRIDEILEQQAFKVFSKLRDKDVSFIDCTCFVLCQTLGIQYIFGFDKHYEKQGFRLVKPK